jgi:hypothetical protein
MKRKSHFGRKVLIVLLVMAAALAVCWYTFGRSMIKKAVADTVTDDVIENAITATGIADDETAQAIVDSVSEEDKAAVSEIIENHVNSDMVSKGLSYVSNGDISGLKQYAENELTSDELAQLKGIAEKYASDFSGGLN